MEYIDEAKIKVEFLGVEHLDDGGEIEKSIEDFEESDSERPDILVGNRISFFDAVNSAEGLNFEELLVIILRCGEDWDYNEILNLKDKTIRELWALVLEHLEKRFNMTEDGNLSDFYNRAVCSKLDKKFRDSLGEKNPIQNLQNWFNRGMSKLKKAV